MPEHGRAYLADLTNMPEAPTPPSSTPATTRRKDKFRTIIDFWNTLERNLDGGGSGTLGPMERLMRAMREASTLYVVTRGMREIRAILIGRLVAFDRYWNLVLANVTEYKINTSQKLRSSSGPGRQRRKMQRQIRKQQGKIALRAQEASQSLPTDAGASDELWNVCVGGDEASHEVDMDACTSPLYSLDPPKGVGVQFDDSSGFNPSETACSVRTYCQQQLFIRGANIVLIRVLPTEVRNK
uniref:Sm domain-containing protein n=1 Tax=Mesocestoides corti TaxID=53468 RepID=A0A5K3EPI8_MESCO